MSVHSILSRRISLLLLSAAVTSYVAPATSDELRVGFAQQPITPEVQDQWIDVNDDAQFDPDVDEWIDQNNNGEFDPVWIADHT